MTTQGCSGQESAQHLGDVLGVVAEVGVHLNDVLRTVGLESPPCTDGALGPGGHPTGLLGRVYDLLWQVCGMAVSIDSGQQEVSAQPDAIGEIGAAQPGRRRERGGVVRKLVEATSVPAPCEATSLDCAGPADGVRPVEARSRSNTAVGLVRGERHDP
jgi:hypothetical protein